MSGRWTKGKGQFFSYETWSVNYEWHWAIAIWSCADTLDFRLRGEKMFCMKNLLILPKFNEKTLSRSEDIKIFRPGRRIYMYALPPFMDEVLSEERQLMKWVGIFQVEIFRGCFSRGEFDGWEFSGVEFFWKKFSQNRNFLLQILQNLTSSNKI